MIRYVNILFFGGTVFMNYVAYALPAILPTGFLTFSVFLRKA